MIYIHVYIIRTCMCVYDGTWCPRACGHACIVYMIGSLSLELSDLMLACTKGVSSRLRWLDMPLLVLYM